MRANYGIDAPTVVRNLLAIGGLLIVVGLLPFSANFRWLIYPGISLFVTGLIMVLGSRVGKLRVRDNVLDRLGLKGDEQVLDVGCGRGLMLIGAAKRLTTGQATGIDLWQTVDQSGNSPQTTLDNAKAEGVEGRVKIDTGDARKLPYGDATFDVIVSSWALHNIPDRDGRRAAIDEIARVLKPGGRVALVDISCTGEYEARAKEIGFSEVQLSGPNFLFVTPTRTLTAAKP